MNPLFDTSTRLKQFPLSTLTRPTGGGLTQVDLPKAGILAGIFIAIRGSVAGTLSAPNALGMASIIRRVTLRVNAGQVVFDVSGAGYHYLLRDMLDLNDNRGSYTNARAAVTATTFNLDMFIPVSKDIRDQMGLISLQNQTTLANLAIDWEADATVATGATVTGTAVPQLLLFEVPTDPKAWPTFDTLHQCIEETAAIPSTADFDHNIMIGGTIIGEYYLYPSAWTRSELRVQQTNVIYPFVPNIHQIWFDMLTGRDVTLSGALTGNDKRIFLDFEGSDGLGQFGSLRDVVDTTQLSSFFNRITPSASGTLTAIRRQIVNMQ